MFLNRCYHQSVATNEKVFPNISSIELIQENWIKLGNELLITSPLFSSPSDQFDYINYKSFRAISLILFYREWCIYTFFIICECLNWFFLQGSASPTLQFSSIPLRKIVYSSKWKVWKTPTDSCNVFQFFLSFFHLLLRQTLFVPLQKNPRKILRYKIII